MYHKGDGRGYNDLLQHNNRCAMGYRRVATAKMSKTALHSNVRTDCANATITIASMRDSFAIGRKTV
jgi:hypothetical protein